MQNLTYSFPNLEPVCCSTSSSNCCFLTCIQISQEAGQVLWYSHLLMNFPQFVVIHTVKGFGVVNKAEVDVFLEHSCFFNDPMDVGNWISGSSAFSKSNLNIWKFNPQSPGKQEQTAWVHKQRESVSIFGGAQAFASGRQEKSLGVRRAEAAHDTQTQLRGSYRCKAWSTQCQRWQLLGKQIRILRLVGVQAKHGAMLERGLPAGTVTPVHVAWAGSHPDGAMGSLGQFCRCQDVFFTLLFTHQMNHPDFLFCLLILNIKCF